MSAPEPMTEETLGFLARAGVSDARIAAMRETMEAAPEPKEIPDGKILVAHPGAVDADQYSRMTVLDEVAKGRKTYTTLYHRAPGYDAAGSMARWTNGGFGVRTDDGSGSYGGARFNTAEEAVARFNLWTSAP